MTEFEFGGYSCRVERFGNGETMALLFSGFERQLFCDICGILEKSGASLTLAEFGPIDWDRDYSPWEAVGTAGRKFSGGADRLAAFLPEFTAELARRYGEFKGVRLCGYSLGGLFALYAATVWNEPKLCGAASCSGSMWFPGWVEYLKEHPLRCGVYLSLGGKEKNSPDPMMSTVEARTLEVRKILARTTNVIWRSEPGGHFSHIPERLSRAIMAEY